MTRRCVIAALLAFALAAPGCGKYGGPVRRERPPEADAPAAASQAPQGASQEKDTEQEKVQP